MKLKIFLATALAAGVISAGAATANVPAATNSPTTAPAKADDMTALFGDPVIVKGNGFQIKRSELDQMVSAIKARAAMQQQQITAQESDQISVNILERLIAYQVLLQKATPEDRAAGQKDADTQIDKIVKQADAQGPGTLERQLKSEGMTLADLKEKSVQEATANAVLKRTLSVNITDAQIHEAYSNHVAAFQMPETAHARHILLMTIDPDTHAPLATNAVAAKRKQIDDILKRAQSGEDFAALAKQYSEDKQSAVNGGELPKFSHGEMVPEFESAAFALKPGQLSDVVTTMYGYHIIKLIDKTPAKQYGLMENIPQVDRTPASICKDQLESEQMAKQMPALIEKLRGEQKVEIVDTSLKSLEQTVLAEATNAPAAGANQ